MADDPLSLPGEVWKPVHANPDQYRVSSLGRICNIRRGRLLSQEDRHENGYRRVGIHKDGAQKTWPVHILVCIAFHGPRPEGRFAIHRNGDCEDNRADNLRWGTPWENSQDRIRHGNAPRGSQHKRAKLNEAMVYELRLRAKRGPMNSAHVAATLGIDRSTLKDAISGKCWTHVPMP